MATARPILSVIGPHSNCGKTTFIVQVLARIPELGTLKISPVLDGPEASTPGDGDVAEDFFLERPDRLHRPGKDTALYVQAGARHVERLRHRAGGLPVGITAAIARFPPDLPLIVESSRAVRLLTPVAVVLVVRPPPREIKPSTLDILPLVTDLVINASDREGLATTAARHLQQNFPTLQPAHTWTADLVTEPLPEHLLDRLQRLLARRTGR
jgi:hypothetical protein